MGAIFPILFLVLSLGTAFLLTFSMLKKQTNQKISILLCIFLTLTFIVFMLIPPQMYVVSLYTLVQKLSFIQYLQIFYGILSLATIITNALFAIRKERMKI